MFQALKYGVIGNGLKANYFGLSCYNPRDYADNPRGYVDDKPYGGGPGMLLKVHPMRAAIKAAKEQAIKPKVIYLSPRGKKPSQSMLQTLIEAHDLIFVAGRYEGIDERVIEHDIDEQWSIGDIVLSGGELAAMVYIDALARLIPGVLGAENAAFEDSFSDDLLEHPQYTRPECIDGQSVPEVLLSGNHRAIARWQKQQALGKTWLHRPDLLAKRVLTELETELLEAFKQNFYRSQNHVKSDSGAE